MSDQTLTRREFVKVGAVGAAGAAIALTAGSTQAAAMPERPLGKTGHKVRIFSLGGQATIEKPGTHDESIAIVNRAIDLGVNYIDTAAAYGRPARRRQAAMGARGLEPDPHRRGHGHTPQGGLPREQDRRPDARRLAAAAGTEPEAAEDRSPRPVAAAQHLDRRPAGPDLRKGRGDRGAAEGAGREDGALPGHHRPLRPRRADAGHRAVRVRHDPDGPQPCRQAPPALCEHDSPAREQEEHGRDRHEDPRARPDLQARGDPAASRAR